MMTFAKLTPAERRAKRAFLRRYPAPQPTPEGFTDMGELIPTKEVEAMMRYVHANSDKPSHKDDPSYNWCRRHGTRRRER